jgi:hypothetical protein
MCCPVRNLSTAIAEGASSIYILRSSHVETAPPSCVGGKRKTKSPHVKTRPLSSRRGMIPRLKLVENQLTDFKSFFPPKKDEVLQRCHHVLFNLVAHRAQPIVYLSRSCVPQQLDPCPRCSPLFPRQLPTGRSSAPEMQGSERVPAADGIPLMQPRSQDQSIACGPFDTPAATTGSIIWDSERSNRGIRKGEGLRKDTYITNQENKDEYSLGTKATAYLAIVCFACVVHPFPSRAMTSDPRKSLPIPDRSSTTTPSQVLISKPWSSWMYCFLTPLRLSPFHHRASRTIHTSITTAKVGPPREARSDRQ